MYCLRSCGKVGLIRSINVCEVKATMTPHWIKVRWFLNISTASGWIKWWCHFRLGCSCVCCALCECVSVFVLCCAQCANKAEQESIRAYRKEMVKGQHPFHMMEWSSSCWDSGPALHPVTSTHTDFTLFFSVSFQFRNSRKEFVWQLSIPSYWQPRLFFEKPKEKIMCWSLSFFFKVITYIKVIKRKHPCKSGLGSSRVKWLNELIMCDWLSRSPVGILQIL